MKNFFRNGGRMNFRADGVYEAIDYSAVTVIGIRIERAHCSRQLSAGVLSIFTDTQKLELNTHVFDQSSAERGDKTAVFVNTRIRERDIFYNAVVVHISDETARSSAAVALFRSAFYRHSVDVVTFAVEYALKAESRRILPGVVFYDVAI